MEKQGSLLKKTIQLYNKANKTPLEMHKESGLSYYWLKNFGRGDTRDPSVNKVQALYEYLSGKKLDI